MPIYLRSGKALWKRGTEIVVQFKKAPEVIFRDTPVASALESNRLIFHIQPDQGIEIRFHAKTPGPTHAPADGEHALRLRRGVRGLARHRLRGAALQLHARRRDAVLARPTWSRRPGAIAQPILDAWENAPPDDFPNYPAGSWGPKAAFDLMASAIGRWVEVINRSVLEQVPLFEGGDPVFLHNLAMCLRPRAYSRPATRSLVRGRWGRRCTSSAGAKWKFPTGQAP